MSPLSLKWPWIFRAFARSASLIARASVALPVLRATLSPALNTLNVSGCQQCTYLCSHPWLLVLARGDGLDDSDVINALANEASN